MSLENASSIFSAEASNPDNADTGAAFTLLRRLVGDSANEFFKYRLGNCFRGEICPDTDYGNTESCLGTRTHMRAKTRGAAASVRSSNSTQFTGQC